MRAANADGAGGLAIDSIAGRTERRNTCAAAGVDAGAGPAIGIQANARDTSVVSSK
jgi:hypothetical protein